MEAAGWIAIAFLVVVVVLAWRFRTLDFTLKALGFEGSVKASGANDDKPRPRRSANSTRATGGAVAVGGDPHNAEELARALASGTGSVAIGGDANHANISVMIGDQRWELTTAEAVEALREAHRRILLAPLNNLPPQTAHFEGRGEEEEKLLGALARGAGVQAISALRGIGGIGKTELAVRVAHKLSLHYPAAQLLVALKGTTAEPTSPRAAMEDVLRRFEPAAKLPDDDDAVSELYRDCLGNRKALLILDNARDAAQVMPLLPPPPSAALVTSRPLLDLPGVEGYRLDSLERPQSRALLAALVGEPALTDTELDALAEACVDHPLSVQVAGNFLANRRDRLSLGRYITRIRDDREALRLEGVEGFDVMAALGASLALLVGEDPTLAERWRDLAVFATDFDAPAAAAVWGRTEKSPPAEAPLDVLSRLEDMAFVEPGGGPERFRLHDLMRDLAKRGEPEERFRGPAYRHAAHYCAFLAQADQHYLGGGGEGVLAALRLFDLARGNIEAGQALAAKALGSDKDAAALACQYALGGAYVLSLRLHPREWIRWSEDAAAGARETGNRRGEGNALGNLGLAHAGLGETRKAIELYEQQLEITREIGDRRGEGNALGNLGLAYAGLGETRKAIELYEQQLEITREIGDRRGEGNALGNLGLAYAGLGETQKAIALYEQRLEIAREIGDRRGEGNALGSLSLAYAALGEIRKAIEFHEQYLEIAREIGDRSGEGNGLGNLGNAYAALGETRKAIEFHEQQLEITREIGDRRGEGNGLGNLGVAYARLGETRKAIEHYEQALSIFVAIEDPNADRVREWLAAARAQGDEA